MAADLHEIIELYLDGEMSAAACADLETRLASDVSAALLYAERATLRHHLAERFAFDERVAPAAPMRTAPAEAAPVRPARSMALAAAMVIGGAAVMVVLVALVAGRQSPDAPPVATAPPPRVGVVIDTPNAIWLSEPVYDGEDLRRQSVRLDAGVLSYISGTGATVSIHGPAAATVYTADHVALVSGLLRAEVPDGAAGFTVDGPRGWSVVDLGTRFDVDVTPEGRMRVMVDEGRVVLRSPEGQETQLAAGDGRTIASDNRVIGPGDDPWLRWRLAMGRLRSDGDTLAVYDFEDDAESTARLHNAALRPGRFGDRVISLAGDGYASIDGPGELDAFTLSAWVKPTRIDADMAGLVMTDGWGAAEVHWQLHDGRAKLNIEGHAEAVATRAVEAGRWNHVAVTFDGHRGLIVLYLDGDPVAEHAIAPGSKAVLGEATIGAWRPLGLDPEVEYTRALHGDIDEVVIQKRTMSAGAVRDLYRATLPGNQGHVDRGPNGKDTEHDASEE